jgi:integrase
MLKVQKYSTNYTGHQLKQIKTICKEADRNGLQVHPFTKHIEGFRQRRSDRFIHTISFEEIERIKNLQDLAPELENTRKWMLIGFYSGQRVSDLLKLTKVQVRHVMNGVYMDVTQQKNG